MLKLWGHTPKHLIMYSEQSLKDVQKFIKASAIQINNINSLLTAPNHFRKKINTPELTQLHIL